MTTTTPLTDLADPPAAPPPSVPVPNRRTDDQATFDTKADAYLNWMVAFAAWLETLLTWLGTFGGYLNTQLATLEGHKNSAQAAAAAAEVSAQSAALVAGAQRWQAGDYAQGAVVWSPLSLLTYRRVPEGTTASATDPALDPAGWRLSGSPHSMPQQVLSTAGPHQLVTGMHYIITAPDCIAHMPPSPAGQEQLRVTNASGSITPQLHSSTGTFKGHAGHLRLNAARADHTFTFTPNQGWI